MMPFPISLLLQLLLEQMLARSFMPPGLQKALQSLLGMPFLLPFPLLLFKAHLFQEDLLDLHLLMEISVLSCFRVRQLSLSGSFTPVLTLTADLLIPPLSVWKLLENRFSISLCIPSTWHISGMWQVSVNMCWMMNNLWMCWKWWQLDICFIVGNKDFFIFSQCTDFFCSWPLSYMGQ